MLKVEAWKFAITGIISNTVNFLTYVSSSFVLQNLVLSSTLGYVVGLVNSYYLGKIWVFNSKSKISFKEVIKFLIVYLIGGIGMVAIIWVLSDKYNIDYRLSWIFGAFFAVINNFFGSKFIVYK
ncbi:MAG: GtrA family protein [Candidatus Marinimicrobia bacterium]|nr:GtrA family protein [Candidatus Neomarinimicrobiota bacterium]